MQAGVVGIREPAEAVTRRLAASGASVAVLDGGRRGAQRFAGVPGVVVRRSLATLAKALAAPRTLIVFEGDEERDLAALARCAGAGALVADAGEGAPEAAAAHAAALAAEGVSYVDVALFTSPASVSAGFGVVAGGSAEAYARFAPLARALGFQADYAALRAGPAGAARFLRALQALLARQSVAGVEQLLRGIQESPRFIGSPAALLSAWQGGAAGNAEVAALCERYLALAGADGEGPAAAAARAWGATARTAAAFFEQLAAAQPRG